MFTNVYRCDIIYLIRMNKKPESHVVAFRDIDKNLLSRIKIIAKAKRIPIYRLVNEYLQTGLLVDAELEEIKKLYLSDEDIKEALDRLVKRQALRRRTIQ